MMTGRNRREIGDIEARLDADGVELTLQHRGDQR